MPFDVTESVLPGVGKKYELYLDENRSLSVIIHSDGKREVYYREHSAKDYEPVVQLTDSQARTLGLFLVGAYYQPVVGHLPEETESGEYIEWYSITPNSPVVDAGPAAIEREVTDLTLLGIEREGTVASAPAADTILQAGDRLIILGDNAAHKKIERFLEDE